MKAGEKEAPTGAARPHRGKDIAGQRFGRLTALYPLEQRSKKRNVVWHCRCECGREADFSYNALLYSNLKSCGCQKQEHHRRMSGYLTHVDGTSLDRLKSEKINSNNTSGARGVYFIRGKYVAKMVFQKKQYVLGTFKTFEEAARIRAQAEEAVHQSVAVYYAKWKERAEDDPIWVQENPMRIAVGHSADGGLELHFSPEMEE